jgi:hypothetical protein
LSLLTAGKFGTPVCKAPAPAAAIFLVSLESVEFIRATGEAQILRDQSHPWPIILQMCLKETPPSQHNATMAKAAVQPHTDGSVVCKQEHVGRIETQNQRPGSTIGIYI